MPRSARKASETDIYHVTLRGAGRKAVFAEDGDKAIWTDILTSSAAKHRNLIFAWCIMDNHAHMLMKASLRDLSKCMHLVSTRYAAFYNGRNGHVGPVFQDRFHSLPVESEEHFMCTVRYIHLNPLDQGVGHSELARHEWCSYHEYIQGSGLCDIDSVLSLFGGKEKFLNFHRNENISEHLVELHKYGRRLSDAEAKGIAGSCLGEDFADRLPMLSKALRDDALKKLKRRGLSVRQIERLTGLGREIVRRA